MILVVNLNLTIDHVLEVPHLTPGAVHRATAQHQQAGGKGVNVARTLKLLSVPSQLLGLTAGRAGAYIRAELAREAIAHDLIESPGESRTCLILLDAAASQQTVINGAGPEIPPAVVDTILARYTADLPAASLVVLTGSLPPGVRASFYGELVTRARAAGKPILLDAAGDPLRYGLQAKPTIVKTNHHEAGDVTGSKINTIAEALAAATRLVTEGAQIGAITLGARGMVVASAAETFYLQPPALQARNAVGAGDATAAGFAAGWVRELGLVETARLAVACGSASALHGFGRFSQNEVAALQEAITVTA